MVLINLYLLLYCVIASTPNFGTVAFIRYYHENLFREDNARCTGNKQIKFAVGVNGEHQPNKNPAESVNGKKCVREHFELVNMTIVRGNSSCAIVN